MPVPQHVLNWLYSVLTSEYHDVNRTYSDVARALGRFPTLAPRTDVHTFPNGSSALLLHISGTLPVVFRGSTYRFPLSIWVPHAYPREPPLVYVTPTEAMMVRPGQHVDPQGQVYHPYLVRWSEFWDKSTLEDFLTVLSDVFAKEPPVISRQAQRPAVRGSSLPTPTPPPLPPLPPEMATSPSPVSQHPRSSTEARPPPPPPPKPYHDSRSVASISPPSRTPSGAALSQSPIRSRYDSAPPLPPVQPSGQPVPRPQPQPQLQQHPQQHPHQFSQQHMGHIPSPPHAPIPHPQNAPYGSQQPPAYPQGQWQPQGPPPTWNGPAAAKPQPQPAPPPPNILDEPLTLELPAHTVVAAPPIPPNPEKDALLRQLAQTLAAVRQRSRQQNESSMAGLRAQRTAMQAAVPALQSEMSQLTQLSNVLSSNANILHDALRKADGVIEGSKNHPAADIDDLLVAPTVVSNQLYTLVAEERALGDAIFMLGRAVERGRISPAVFAKMTRSLAREWYLKKALVRKIGQGMGMASS